MKHTEFKLYNTLTKQVETFKPRMDGKVGMYHCGPTVYDYPHIGNLRSYVFADTLRRTCEFLGYTVNQVINITDVGHLVSDADVGDDKMEKSAIRSGKTAQEIAEYFTQVFFDNLKDLNINTTGTHFPRATGFIDEQIAFIQKLEDAGHTYITSDGVYFNVATYTEYGKLGNIDLKGLEAGHRIGENSEKKTPYDFALWKFSPTDGAKRQQEWQSPWGVGFPGWHIECSAMSQHILGETFDIHTGGIDHIPVHHNNEIAQSECLSHKPLAMMWMHGAFLNWKDKKMSKSDGAFVRLQDLTEKGITLLAFRYFLLQSKYRQEVVFDMESLQASQTAYTRLLGRVNRVWQALSEQHPEEYVSQSTCQELTAEITKKITDDLNTPQVLAYLWDVLKNEEILKNISQKDFEKFTENIDKILGLELTNECKPIVSKTSSTESLEFQKLQSDRQKARQEKNWVEADRLREEMQALGFEVID
jgi:cysteinyl-tRNA synthetase